MKDEPSVENEPLLDSAPLMKDNASEAGTAVVGSTTQDIIPLIAMSEKELLHKPEDMIELSYYISPEEETAMLTSPPLSPIKETDTFKKQGVDVRAPRSSVSPPGSDAKTIIASVKPDYQTRCQ